MAYLLRHPLGYLWSSPNSLVALTLALPLWLLSRMLGRPTASEPAALRWHTGVLEASGGLIASVLRRAPTSGTLRRPGGAAALTLGHVVFAVDRRTADRTRRHERVHVRQYERWGPLFLPAYLLATWSATRRGESGYYANRFEREAYAVSHPGRFPTNV